MSRIALVLALCLLPPRPAPAEPVRVAAAVSLKEALTEVAAAYRKDGRGEVKLAFGSSGQLQAQIEYGAPIDAFISAANHQLDGLEKVGRIDPATRRVVAGNRLVLVAPAGAKSPPKNLADLSDARHRRVAAGEPRTVPAGQYAAQALKAAGLADAMKGRMIHGANVRQVLDYVERGEVDAGIVYATDARASGGRVRVVETIDASLHDTVEYPAAVVADRPRAKAASDFLEYLATPAARAVFADHGFVAAPAGSPVESPVESPAESPVAQPAAPAPPAGK